MSRRKFLLVGAILSTCLLVSIQASQSDVGPDDDICANEIGASCISIGDRRPPCGIGHPSTSNRPRIYGGVEAEPGEYPWMVNIISPWGGHYCGGVIIDKRHILTAKHCIGDVGSFIMSYKLYIGDYDQTIEDGEQSVGIERVMFKNAPSVDIFSKNDDIALVRTSQEMKFRLTDNRLGSINEICLPESINFKLEYNTNATVIGWGRTEKVWSPDKLRKVQVSIKKCDDQTDEASRYTLCATADNGKDACNGDSGGPLFVRSATGQFVLVGIVQGGPTKPCGDGSRDGFYANVHTHLEWINEYLYHKY